MKNTAFLTEQLIAILIFAVCAAVCSGILAASHTMADAAKDINNALLIAESAAEAFKSAGGSAENAAAMLGGGADESGVKVYYDGSLNICEHERALYVLSISDERQEDAPALLIFGRVSVQKEGSELVAFTTAVRRRNE